MGKTLGKSDLSTHHCSVDYYFGSRMHTQEAGPIDEEKWVYQDCDESKVKDNILYKVWHKTSTPRDPADLSSLTIVYYYEEVPENILKMKNLVDEYWKSRDPLT